MHNLIFGILTVILTGIGYFYSWKFQKQDNYKTALLLLLCCGLVLRFYTACDFYLHEWDERYHALVAKNLMEHPLKPMLYAQPLLPYDYKNWTANHIWLHKQPLTLWTLAASMKLFGINEIALRLPSIILTTLGIGLTYFIGSYLFSRKTGYLAAFFYSINGFIIELAAGRTATDHTDIFFLFFVELAIFFVIVFIRKNNTVFNVFAGLATGAAVLCKWLPALIVVPIWILLVMDKGEVNWKSILLQLLLLCLCCVLVFLPWQLYIFNTFPQEAHWESVYNLKHMTEGLEGHAEPFYYFLDKIRIQYGELIYLPLLYFGWRVCSNPKDKKRLSVLVWFLIPLFFFSFARTKMPAYMLFTTPALFLITADFWYQLAAFTERQQRYRWLSILVLFLLIALPVRYSIERIKPFEKRDRNPLWSRQLKELGHQKIRNGILFNYEKNIEAMFYTKLIAAYPYLPDEVTIKNLQAKGYEVILNDASILPTNLKTIKAVKIVQLSIKP